MPIADSLIRRAKLWVMSDAMNHVSRKATVPTAAWDRIDPGRRDTLGKVPQVEKRPITHDQSHNQAGQSEGFLEETANKGKQCRDQDDRNDRNVEKCRE